MTSLVSCAADRARVVAEIFPSYTYPRPDPEALIGSSPFIDGLRDFYRALDARDRRGEASRLVALDDVSLCRDVLYLPGSGRASVVEETYRECDRLYTALAGAAKLVLGRALHRETGGVQLYVGSVGSSNWGHFLVDDLPRIAAVCVLAARHPGEEIVIVLSACGRLIDARRQEAIAGFIPAHVRWRIRWVRRGGAYHFARLHYATPVSVHPTMKSPQAMAFVRGERPRHGRKLLVARRAGLGRSLRNADEIKARLIACGYELFDPEAKSFAEQAAAFAAADEVVGVMGAAMTNAIFCAPGARVTHLAPEGWREPFYWDLAAACGHRYRAIYGAVEAGPGQPHEKAFTFAASALAGLI